MKKITDWIKNEHHSFYFVYGVLALVIMLPLLLPGFILTLDMVFVPNMPFPDNLSNTWLLEFLMWLINFILPAELIQKIILLAILVLSGVGMHRLVKNTADINPEYLKWAAYFGGIFYMINPFTYSRFMAGQWLVLLGYAMLPFFVHSVINLMIKPGKQTAIRAGLWATAVAFVSIHQTGIMAIVLITALGIMVWKYWRKPQLKKLLKWSLVSVGLALVLNSFWLLPAALGQTEIGQSINTFDSTHHIAFATDSSGPFGAIGNVIRLQGFWVEPLSFYMLPQAKMPIWGLISIMVWILVGTGLVVAWRRQRFMALLFGILGLIGILLAATPITSWLEVIFNGYREPHKFAALIALAYAYFGALGTIGAARWASKRWGDTGVSVALGVALLLPFLLTPVMLWGFGGQLKTSHYPQDWDQINQQLNQENITGRGLFLPWHQYMEFDFAGRIIANPAEKYFDKPIIISDNPEFAGISPAYPNQEKRQIEQALASPETLSETLNQLNIQFVLLAKDNDYQDYAYLDEVPDLTLVAETDSLKYYKNEAYQP